MFAFILGIIAFCGLMVCSFIFKSAGKIYTTVCRIAAFVLLIACLAASCISRVPTGHTGIVTTFGKVHDETLNAGLAWHAPWDNVINMDNREQRVSFNLQAFSKDIQQVDIQGSINININKATAMILYREVGVDYINIFVTPRIQEDVKIIIAKYTAEKLIESRQEASDSIYELIKTELADKGINVISLALENVDFTDAFESAVEAKQVATQEKQRAQTEQERMTMEEEAKAKRAVIVANAEAEKAKIAAQAELEVVKIQAEAALYAGEKEAEMNKRISESLTSPLINYYWIKQWNGKLPTVSTESMMPVLTMEGVLTNDE
jgi:regulator of protease activity HflC (stomatin/prohibitin superfamily)